MKRASSPARPRARARSAAVALAGLAACSTPPPVHDWSRYDGPGAEHFRREEIALPYHPDPLEGFNRAVFSVNAGLFTDVVEPVAELYRAVVPGVARRGLRRAFENLLFPGRLVNNLLQGQWNGAWDETRRFVVNTTVGIAGFRDAASSLGIEPSEEDFGTTFQSWGWDRSTYLVTPFFGPSTARDALGFLLDVAADPATYHRPAPQVRSFNRLSDEMPAIVEALESQFDPYSLARFAYLLGREEEPKAESERVPRAVPDTVAAPDGATETLGTIFLVPEDEDFAQRAATYEIVHPATGARVPYSLWLQPEPAPVDYVIPGLGGHRASISAVALAEAVFAAGKSAVTISSAFNFEFIEGASSALLPGFLPTDARDTHVLLDAIDADLRRRFPGRLTGRRLGGISFGGLTTLFIAAAHGTPGLIDFDAYLAVNAPLGLEHGARRIDDFYNAPLALPPAERSTWIASLYRKTLEFRDHGSTAASRELPFTALEARFLIGLVFRASLRDVILQTQLRHDLGVLHAPLDPERRLPAELEIAQFSFMEYVYAFMLPYLASIREDVERSEAGAARIFELCHLRSIAAELAANPRVRFATNRNDFVLGDGDLEWIVELLGEDRVTIFERGGHLGNLHRQDVRAVLEAEIREAAESP